MLFTTFSPIKISPEVISSRPAIILSIVDFPQPEGPTSTINSLSLTSRFIFFTISTFFS